MNKRRKPVEFDRHDSAHVRDLVEDCINICLAHNRVTWMCPRNEVLKSLRGNRWSFYTPRSNRTWAIGADAATENMLWQTLAEYGFEFEQGCLKVTAKVHKPAHIPFDPPLHSNPKFVAEIVAAGGIADYKGNRRPKQTPRPLPSPKLLEIEPNETIDELLETLKSENDQGMKKKIRARLRKLGHKGGSRG